MLLTVCVVLVVALPLALGSRVVLNGLSRSRRCPICAGETLRLRSRATALVSRLLRDEEVHRRWCPGCGWTGGARLPRLPLPARAWSEPDPAPVAPAPPVDGVDVRRLDVDGRPVRVRVQCWAEGGAWCGRLLFTGTDGRTWREDASTLRGRSPGDVLCQALTLPDRALVGRVRRVMRGPGPSHAGPGWPTDPPRAFGGAERRRPGAGPGRRGW